MGPSRSEPYEAQTSTLYVYSVAEMFFKHIGLQLTLDPQCVILL